MIKLTELNFGTDKTEVRESPIWVVATRIVYMRQSEIFGVVCTDMCMGAPHFARVKETPDEISAMLE